MPQRGTPPPVVLRRPIIGVMGSGREPHVGLSAPLGSWLASTGCNLLTGGGRGVMECVSRTFSETPGREGQIIGVIPALPGASNEDSVIPPAGYPNPYTEIVIRTQCPLSMHPLTGTELTSRNHINILSSDIVVALPGSSGTWSEIQLAIRYRKPLILFLGEDGDDIDLAMDGVEDIKVAKSMGEVRLYVEEALERRRLRATSQPPLFASSSSYSSSSSPNAGAAAGEKSNGTAMSGEEGEREGGVEKGRLGEEESTDPLLAKATAEGQPGKREEEGGERQEEEGGKDGRGEVRRREEPVS